MKKIRWNLFAKFVMALGLSLITAAPVYASGTKVGNGDDGADLEALTFITSGPILEARKRAVETLKQLNVVGIPGLGLLIPELEQTNLLMAATNVHPTGEQKGSLEISTDKGFVYARTFAEPYAATRFFPIAETLTPDQLVALHIHEALHRALPSDIRMDEDKVMHLTMAMTSPGASFDRVHQVASLYISSNVTNTAQRPSSFMTSTMNIEPVSLPAKSRTEVRYSLDVLHERKFAWATNVLHGVELKTSLGGYKSLKFLAVEPVFRFRAKFFQKFGSEEGETGLGMTSYDLEGRTKIDDQTVVGPFIRFTTKSLDERQPFSLNERDLTTVGAFYRNKDANSYFESNVSYSFASTGGSGEVFTAKYNPILSLIGRTGFKWGRLSLGGLFDVHASEGREISESEQATWNAKYGYGEKPISDFTRAAFRILAAGPEIGYEGKIIQFKYYAKQILNESAATFDDLGDIMDHGGGESMTGISLSAAF